MPRILMESPQLQTDDSENHIDSCTCSPCLEEISTLADRISARHCTNISTSTHVCRDQVADLEELADFDTPKDTKVVQMIAEKTMKPFLERMLVVVRNTNSKKTSFIRRRRKKDQNSFARYHLGGIPCCAISTLFSNICMYEPALAKMAEFAPQLLTLYQIMLTAALEHTELTDLKRRRFFREDDEEVEEVVDSDDSSDDDDELDIVPWLVVWCIHNILMIMKARRLTAFLGDGHPKLASFGSLLLQMLNTDNIVAAWFGMRMSLYLAEVGGPVCVAKLNELGLGSAAQSVVNKARTCWREGTALRRKESDFLSCLLRHASLLTWELREPGTVNYYKSQSRLDRLGIKHDHDDCVFSPKMLEDEGMTMDVICSSPVCLNIERNASGRFGACARCRMARYCSEQCQRIHWLKGHKEYCFTKKEVLATLKQTDRTAADS